VAVPAFFRIRLTGVSRDGRAHTVRFRGARLRVPAGGRASVTVDGLPKGLYGVTVDGVGGAVTIASGAGGGP
jgi:hypothetical protein